MKVNFVRSALALAALLFCLDFSPAAAQQLPAVSGPNGKIEFDAGALSLPSPMFMGRASGTITLPIGDRFGIQADFSGATAPGLSGSTALHVFTRDPQSYLIGGTLGLVRTPGATVVAAGPEGEWYLRQWTIEAWGGVALVYPSAPAPSRTGVFGMADVAYYPTPNLKLSLGLSSLDGYNAVQFGSEYLLDDWSMPVAITGEARIGQDGAVLATIGLRAYFGAPHKSLIDRHRQDDPSDRGTELYTAAGGATLVGTGSGSPGGGGAGVTNPSGGSSGSDTPSPPLDCSGVVIPEGCGPGFSPG